MNAKHLPVLLYGLAVLLAVFAYFYGLDSQYIPKNGDEYPYAHITRLTAESGHLLPLQSQLDHMRDTKPPLLFWQGIAATDWGQDWDLWHLRIPSVIYTVLTALLVFVLTLRLSGKTETGLVAVLAWLAFFSTYRYGRPFLANPPEVFWMTLPMFALLAWPRATFDSRLAAPLLVGVALGAALLYKSFALLAPAGITLAWWYLHQRRYNWHAFIARDGAKLAIIVAAALAVFALWFALDPNPGAVWREFVLRENFGKLGAHGAGYFSTLLWGGSSVWALLLGYPLNAGLLALPVAVLMWAAWRRRAEMRDAEKMLWMLVTVLFLVFALPSQRSARYLLEGMPALAVLLALGWQRVGRWAFAVSLVLAGLALALFGFLSHHLQHALGGTLYPAACWLLLSAAAVMIAVFAIFAGWYFWFPKITGYMYNETLGKLHFWWTFVGVNITFFPMHFLGLEGMPRRSANYPASETGWTILNVIITGGSVVLAISILVFGWNLVSSTFLRRGQAAGDDPWQGYALEWATTSPPPEYNFSSVPEVRSRRPLWDIKHPEDPDWKYE